MGARPVVVIGAGVGGLVAASELARAGIEVVLLERAGAPGGKLREVEVAGRRLDAGPTVFTMRWVFEEIFAGARRPLDEAITLAPLDVLARHAWSDRERLDLFADLERSADAIGAFAGPAEARGYRRFCERGRAIFQTLDAPFIRSPRPANPMALAAAVARGGLGNLWNIDPFATLARSLNQFFRDPRLRQLFGRYATYVGSSPYLAPATLMLIAHVEQAGVWSIEGGMHRLAVALAELAESRGATIRYGAEVAEIVRTGGRPFGVRLASGERIEALAIVCNADVAALAAGRFGRVVSGATPAPPPRERSLSAVTWNIVTPTSGFALVRHNVFFSNDYPAEFDDLLRRRRLPRAPTVYVCAQDRGDPDEPVPEAPERLLVLVNAPATGDTNSFDETEIAPCRTATFETLERCGLRIEAPAESSLVTTPAAFERLFPATGGALYGQATHGSTASFRRPGARSRIPGLYLAGGSTHPGAGVPMAALSGQLAAASLVADLASISR